MLASPAVRAAGERVGELAAAALAFCALFFADGHANAPLVWIGGLALLLAAVLLAYPPRLDRPTGLFLGGLFGLAVWAGLSTIWSVSPDSSWQFTNRTLVYGAFALAGAGVGSRVSRRRLAEGAAILLALVAGWALLAKCVPALYSDYGRIARLRAPVEYWNELALLCDAGVPLALWLAARRRIEGVVLLYLLVVTLLLTYSRFGVALACAAAAVWIVISRERVAGLAVSIAYAGRIWSEFTNPANTPVANTKVRLGSAKSSRWTWWEESWHAFTRHPGGGTGAGTFELTNQMLRHSPVVVDEPHNTPLQFLSETGIVGLLLYLGVAAGALWGAWRARRDPAGLALGIAVAVFFVHGIVDKDWNYVAACGPFFLLMGALVAPPAPQRTRPRLLLAAGAVAVALAATYSLAAPWLSDRALARADWKQAHSYDPLSVDTLMEWATLEDASGNLDRANGLYLDAVHLEPQNARTWYALGAFYFDHKLWRLAYDALNNSYTYDRFGLAAQPCGLLDRARWNAGFRFGPNCRAGARSSS